MFSMITELQDIEPNGFLSPFLEVIRSEDTTGPITGLALTSVNKFLSYGLVGKYLKESPRTNMFLIDDNNIKGVYKKIYHMMWMMLRQLHLTLNADYDAAVIQGITLV